MHTRLGLVVVACAVGTLAFAQDAGVAAAPPSADEQKPASAADYALRIDELYPKRDDYKAYQQTDVLLRDGLAASPNDYGLLWRAARHRHFAADGLSGDAMEKQAKEGWGYADKAIKANPAGMEGHYYAAVNIGAYSTAVGVITALTQGLEGKFNADLDVAIKADPGYSNAGPLLTKGRYWSQLPWPKRDRQKSRTELEKAVKLAPHALRAWFYLAETEFDDGHPKEAKAALDHVMAGSIDYDPPEARRVKAWGRELAPKIAKELK